MAIKMIKKGDIDCDICGIHVATIVTTSEVINSFEKDEKYTEIRCTGCVEKPIDKKD